MAVVNSQATGNILYVKNYLLAMTITPGCLCTLLSASSISLAAASDLCKRISAK